MNEIRVIVLDSTGPAEQLSVEVWPRARAMAFHRLAWPREPRRRPATPAGNEKPRQRG